MTSSDFVGPVQNAIVLLTGVDDPEIPEAFGQESVVATSTCVAIGTSAETDVRVRFLTVVGEVTGLPVHLVFEGWLPVSNGQLAIENVLGDKLAEWPLDGPESRVAVFVDDVGEPTEIVVIA